MIGYNLIPMCSLDNPPTAPPFELFACLLASLKSAGSVQTGNAELKEMNCLVFHLCVILMIHINLCKDLFCLNLVVINIPFR